MAGPSGVTLAALASSRGLLRAATGFVAGMVFALACFDYYLLSRLAGFDHSSTHFTSIH
jgi:hypothetical protein